MRRIDRLLGRREQERDGGISLGTWLESFSYNGTTFGVSGTSPADPPKDLAGRVGQIHRRNGVVAAAVAARSLLVSQVRPVWRNADRGSDDFGSLGAYDTTFDRRRGSRESSLTRQQLFATAELHVSYQRQRLFRASDAGRQTRHVRDGRVAAARPCRAGVPGDRRCAGGDRRLPVLPQRPGS